MLRHRVTLLLVCLASSTALACSSESSDHTSDALKDAMAEGSAPGSGGKSGSGGSSGSSTGGLPAASCAIDAGADLCQQCLAAFCCQALIDCQGDDTCSAAFATHEACFSAPGAEPSACFGTFVRALGPNDAGVKPPDAILGCIVDPNKCKATCGGPNVV